LASPQPDSHGVQLAQIELVVPEHPDARYCVNGQGVQGVQVMLLVALQAAVW
jgi:hypothetical protein